LAQELNSYIFLHRRCVHTRWSVSDAKHLKALL
jgi:hypothetical protein